MDILIVSDDPMIRAKNRDKIQQILSVNINIEKLILIMFTYLYHPIVIFPLISFLNFYIV